MLNMKNNSEHNSISGELNTLRQTKIITPIDFIARGTFPCQVILNINAMMQEAYGEIAPHLPIGFSAFDSAQATTSGAARPHSNLSRRQCSGAPGTG
jgi:hypothetical protein